ncbi:MAG: PIN domain-containing protein [Spirochaetia bacterium]|nr:PIN domain-containing protein [Spirochaetia bacterium]
MEVRKRYRLKLPDSIIVATAIIENAVLVTADQKLNKIKELKIIEIDKMFENK